jgi:hypothetical protein
MAVKRYVTLQVVKHNGTEFSVGAPMALSDQFAGPLLAVKAIEEQAGALPVMPSIPGDVVRTAIGGADGEVAEDYLKVKKSAQGVDFSSAFQREAVLQPEISEKFTALGITGVRAFVLDIPGWSKCYGWLTYADGTVVTQENLFDRFSTARSTPASTWYADGASGNDTTGDGLSWATAFKSSYKATIAGNGTGAPFCVRVKSEMSYQKCLIGIGGDSAIGTQDHSIIAHGRVAMSSHVDFTAPTIDGTYTTCYSGTTSPAAVTVVDRVVNRLKLDKYGKPSDFVLLASAAAVNASVGVDAYAIEGGKWYVKRADGVAPTITNTRAYVQNRVSQFSGLVNVFIGGNAEGDGFDFCGGAANGPLDIKCATPASTPKVFVAGKGLRLLHAGGNLSVGARSISVDSWHGGVFLFSPLASGPATDAYNAHNTYSAASSFFVTLNAVGMDCGRGAQQSCNAWTTHENVVGLDLAGYYMDTRGAAVRSINSTFSQLVCPYVEGDMGDVAVGGSQQPTAYRADNTAVMYLDNPRAKVGVGYGMVAADTSAIYYRIGTFDTPMVSVAGTLAQY